MDKQDRDILRKNRINLRDNIANPDEVKELLFERDVFTEAMKQDVGAETTVFKKTLKILDILPMRGKKAFDQFYQILIDTKNYDAAAFLKPTPIVEELPHDRPNVDAVTEEIKVIHCSQSSEVYGRNWNNSVKADNKPKLKQLQPKQPAAKGEEDVASVYNIDKAKLGCTLFGPQEDSDSSYTSILGRFICGDVEPDCNLNSICVFCEERNENFTEEGLDIHYWKYCPMLRRCANCKRVIEIACYMDHLISQCESEATYSRCSRCTEAIPKSEYDQHVADKACNAAKPRMNHCPLCHQNISAGEDGWKGHLMGKDGCKQNPRRLLALNKQPPQGGKTTTTTANRGKTKPLAKKK